MTLEIIIQIILFGIALSADAFSVAVAEGLTFTDLNKKRVFFIAGVFGVFQGLFPLIGYWLVEGITQIVDTSAGEKAGHIMAIVVTWVAFGLLLFIGTKMIIDSILEMRKKEEDKELKKFSVKEVLIMGVATAIDALATGVAFHNQSADGTMMSTTTTIWLHASIIIVITFALSLVGLLLGKQITKLLKGKYEISGIIGGTILILLAVWIVVSHYTGL